MKKLSIFVGALTLTSSLFAQDLTSKKGENYLPEAKEWALGIDAVPFLNYFGNFIGGDGLNVAPNWNYATANNTIIGKYFVEEKMAYRGALRIGFGSMTDTRIVSDRAADNTFIVYPTIHPTKENSMKSSFSNFGLAGGLEWRKGTTRLQGFYGGELGFMVGGNKDTYSYGNNLTANAPEPGLVAVDGEDDFGANLVDDSYGNDGRLLEQKTSMFGLGLRAFIGVEYFVLPKLSLGAEFGWGLGFMSVKTSQELESVGIVNGFEQVGKQATDGDKIGNFGIDTDINNTVFGNPGQLKITFHF
jgi:hypothetical protein